MQRSRADWRDGRGRGVGRLQQKAEQRGEESELRGRSSREGKEVEISRPLRALLLRFLPAARLPARPARPLT